MANESNRAEKTKLSKGSLCLLCIALTFFIISLASPYWAYGVLDNIDEEEISNIGIWLSCRTFHGKSEVVCRNVVDYRPLTELQKGLLRGLQALMVLALLLLIIAIISLGFKIYHKNKLFLKASMVLNGVTALLLLAGVSVYAAHLEQIRFHLPGAQLHFAYAFCVIAVFFCLVAEVVMIREITTVRITSS